jgi:hypothetical protein
MASMGKYKPQKLKTHRMKKQTYIYIQEPCHEEWNNMADKEQGRFCHSCSKTVTDFSSMTDTAILQFLSTASSHTCGRFATAQVNRQIHVPATPVKKTFWAYLLSVFLPVMITNRLSAQKKIAVKPATEQISKPGKALNAFPTLNSFSSDSAKLSDTTVNTAIKDEGDTYTSVTMGLIIQYDKVKTTDTVSTFVKKVTKNELFKIFPNPAIRGKKISVQVNKTGEYSLQLLDMNSKMVLHKTIKVSSKSQMVFLDIPMEIASGNYYVRLADSNTQFVDKLVVR